MKNKLITSDIYLAAALLSLGARLDDVDKSDTRHMKFTLVSTAPPFESSHLQKACLDLEDPENAWANGSLMVNATNFKDAIQRMKSVIHSI